MTLRRSVVQGYESSRLTSDTQTSVEDETARRLQPSTLTWYLPDPVPTDDDDEGTGHSTVPSDYMWE
jgi:hypothetical protein